MSRLFTGPASVLIAYVASIGLHQDFLGVAKGSPRMTPFDVILTRNDCGRFVRCGSAPPVPHSTERSGDLEDRADEGGGAITLDQAGRELVQSAAPVPHRAGSCRCRRRGWTGRRPRCGRRSTIRGGGPSARRPGPPGPSSRRRREIRKDEAAGGWRRAPPRGSTPCREGRISVRSDSLKGFMRGAVLYKKPVWQGGRAAAGGFSPPPRGRRRVQLSG